MPTHTPDRVGLALLQQLIASATHDASAAMCRWTSGLISLSLDEVNELSLEDAAATLDLGDDLLTMVILTLDGDVGGTMILTFDEQNGRDLAACLLNRETGEPGTPWSELEKSALNETGNILGCAYMNALTRLVSTDLVPSPPMFVQDFGASVLEQALLQQAATCDVATLCRTTFQRDGQNLNWNVIFLPSSGLRKALIHALTHSS